MAVYSNIKNVQILIKLLKQFNIKDVVLSPGGSDIPIIHSLETDDFFNCYSVVDERNNTYFAMGLSQEKNVPVACVCTSGTAVCNFLPGITEAFYQDVPIIAITADKNPYFQGQLETQKIEQTNMFSDVVKKMVSLPVVKNAEDEWLCNRLVNEALLEVDHHGKGPVQINIPVVGDTGEFFEDEFKEERKITRIELPMQSEVWKQYSQKLQGKKVMVVVGQNILFDKEDKENMSEFFNKCNCIYATEHLSNLNCDGKINTYPISEIGGLNDKLLPDIVISLGNNLAAYNLKPFLRKNYKHIQTWNIDPSGKVRDAYKSLTDIFECKVSYFFENIIKHMENNQKEHEYYSEWKEVINLLDMENLPYSNVYVGKKLAETIPDNSVLHLAILNSTRITQLFDIPCNVHTYSNVGSLGIDGCVATFVGQATATDRKSYLLIGDLSFFYDMNAVALRSVSNNIRIIMINNSGGAEFHFFMGKERISTINDYISAEHHHSAEGWVKSLGYEYYGVQTKEEIDKALERAVKDSEHPIFIEVFTNMEQDAEKTHEIFNKNKYILGKHIGGMTGIKEVIASKLSREQKNKVKNIVKKIKGA